MPGRPPGLAAALFHLRGGDTLVVWRLDRLGRTTHQLVNLLEQFEREGICLRSLQDGIDPTSVMGKGHAPDRGRFRRNGTQYAAERTKAGLTWRNTARAIIGRTVPSSTTWPT